MMLPPNPGVLDTLVRERQSRLRTATSGATANGTVASWRVRIGHALIAAGSTLSDERVERPAHPHAPARA